MKFTKHAHACMELTKSGSGLIIDPGAWTPLLANVNNIAGVVLTHAHPDHWSADQLLAIREASPSVRIFGPPSVVEAAASFDVEPVGAGDEHTVGPFSLRFYGRLHASAHHTLPPADNVGVFVDRLLYYTGDSFVVPTDAHIDTLAVTAGAPWMKIGEVMDLIADVAPSRVIPVHEGVLSDAGNRLAQMRIREATAAAGGTFLPLQPGESVELDA